MTIGRLRIAEIYFQSYCEYMARYSPCAENIGEAHLVSLLAVFNLGNGTGETKILDLIVKGIENRASLLEKYGSIDIASLYRNLAKDIKNGNL